LGIFDKKINRWSNFVLPGGSSLNPGRKFPLIKKHVHKIPIGISIVFLENFPAGARFPAGN